MEDSLMNTFKSILSVAVLMSASVVSAFPGETLVVNLWKRVPASIRDKAELYAFVAKEAAVNNATKKNAAIAAGALAAVTGATVAYKKGYMGNVASYVATKATALKNAIAAKCTRK